MKYFVCTIVFYLTFQLANAQKLTLTEFATGLKNPIGIENCGDERLFILEQPGTISIINENGEKETTPFIDLTSKIKSSGNEQGLLGLAFHPRYKVNGYFFVNYTNTSGGTTVARYQVSNDVNVADASSEKIVLSVTQPYSNHNGGHLAFGNDGCLYIGLGDGGSGGDPQNNAQNTNSMLGKMLRLDIDTEKPYQIPANNPFVEDENVLDEIWSIGLRNPWRYSIDKLTGNWWIADVGQDKWEEIDFESAESNGANNYGWRCYEGSYEYNTNNCEAASTYTKPIFEYKNENQTGCSVTGGFVYRGAKYKSLFGKYVFTDFCTGNIWTITQNGNVFKDSLLGKFTAFNYSTFGQDQYGELYLAERSNGKIMRIDVDECKPSAAIWSSKSSITLSENEPLNAVFHPSMSYQWVLNGEEISGETKHELKVTKTGNYQVIVTNETDCADTSTVVTVTDITSSSREFNSDLGNVVVTNGQLRLSVKNNDLIQEIHIYDALGRILYDKSAINVGSFQTTVSNCKRNQHLFIWINTMSGQYAKQIIAQ
ncbi:MAG: PQQ-dependent sugar dehydrogenase [Bacteroidetes bacterium]|nr:PQQ-dependent sugar dehydrogenase [Bacteroidota bacterium]